MCNEAYNNQALHSVLRSCKYKKNVFDCWSYKRNSRTGIVLSSSVKLNSLAKRYSHSATHTDKPTNFNNSSNKLSLVGLVKKEDSILLINLRNLTGSKSSCDICPTSGNYLIHRYMHHFSHNMWATLRASSCDMRLRSNDYSMHMHWDMYSPSHTMHWLLQLWRSLKKMMLL